MRKMETHTELLKLCYAKWHESRGGSVEDWIEIFAVEVDFRSLAMGRHPEAEFTMPRSSRDEIRSYFVGLLSGWEMKHYTVDHYVEQGDKVCAIGSTAWVNKRTKKTVDTPKIDFWQFENGKAIAFHEYYDTAALIEGSMP